MGTIAASAIIRKAQIILLDEKAGTRWSVNDELLPWLNEGQRAIVAIKPNANIKRAAINLVAGTLQKLPDDCVQLIDVPRNIDANGNAGRAVRIVMREMLDAQVPTWHSRPVSRIVKHYIYAQQDPKIFYVYPSQPTQSPGAVEVVYGAKPKDIQIGEPIVLDDIYEGVLLDYILYRAYSKDSEYANQHRASAHYSAVINALGGRVQTESGANPNVSAPANPATPQ